MLSGKNVLEPSRSIINILNQARQYFEAGQIRDQLRVVRELAESYSKKKNVARFDGVDITSQQDNIIKCLINGIKNHTPDNYPEAKLIYAVFLASQDKLTEAQSYFEEIHQRHPHYLEGYIRHRALVATLPYGHQGKIEELNRAIVNIESKKGKSGWQDNAAQRLFEKKYEAAYKEKMAAVYREVFKSKKCFSLHDDEELSDDSREETSATISTSSSSRSTPSPQIQWFPVKPILVGDRREISKPIVEIPISDSIYSLFGPSPSDKLVEIGKAFQKLKK